MIPLNHELWTPNPELCTLPRFFPQELTWERGPGLDRFLTKSGTQGLKSDSIPPLDTPQHLLSVKSSVKP